MIRKSLHHQVVHQLGLSIFQGRFDQTGALPREEVLINEYGVSRTVLREALRTLVAKGLLEARPKIGTRLRPRKYWNLLDPDMLSWYAQAVPPEEICLNLHEMRELIEPAAAAMAAARHTPQTLAKLKSALEEMQGARSQEEWLAADLSFHEALLCCSGNVLMSPLFNAVESWFEATLKLLAQRAEHYNLSLPQHEAVYAAVEAGDASRAQSAMRTLLQQSAELVSACAQEARQTGQAKA